LLFTYISLPQRQKYTKRDVGPPMRPQKMPASLLNTSVLEIKQLELDLKQFLYKVLAI